MTEPCKFEEKIITLCEDVAVIRNNTERTSRIWIAVIGLAAALIISTISFAKAYGTLENKVSQNEKGVLRLETVVFAATDGR